MTESDRNNSRKSTLITSGLALFFILVAGGVLVFFFHNLKTTDQTYTLLEEPANEVPVTEDETITSLEQISEDAMTSESEMTFSQLLYRNQMNDCIRDEFVVDGHTFYRVNYGSSLEPTEEYLSAEDAAHLALSALQNYFPEQNWDCSFFLHLVPLSSPVTNFSSPKANGVIWYIYTCLDQEDTVLHPSAYLHPITGEAVCVQCPYSDPVYNGSTDEGKQTPFISLSDFITLTDSQTWSSRGVKIIRELDLNEGESIIRYDREAGIRFSRKGEVYATFYIGADENAKKIDLIMDLYTRDFVGFILYEKY